MKTSPTNLAKAIGIVALGAAIAAGGIYVGETDDAPGASMVGVLLLLGSIVVGVRILRHKPLR